VSHGTSGLRGSAQAMRTFLQVVLPNIVDDELHMSVCLSASRRLALVGGSASVFQLLVAQHCGRRYLRMGGKRAS